MGFKTIAKVVLIYENKERKTVFFYRKKAAIVAAFYKEFIYSTL